MKQKLFKVLLIVYLVAFPVLIIVQHYGYVWIRKKGVTILSLSLLIVLIFAFRLYSERITWFIGIFLVWMCVNALLVNGSVIKAFGGTTVGMWYVCLLAYFVAYLFAEKKKTIFMYLLCLAEILGSVLITSKVLVTATGGLFGLNAQSSMLKGMFKIGRLHGLSNANTLGEVETVSILATIWLIIMTKEYVASKKMSKAAGIALIALYAVFFAQSFFILCLSGSRGSIIATAGGVAVMIFAVSKDKLLTSDKCSKEAHKPIGFLIKGIVLPVGIAVVAAVIFISCSFVPKKLYDMYAFGRAEKMYGADSDEYMAIKETLVPYGAGYEVSTLTDRTLIWNAVINMMDEEPIRWLTGVTSAEISNTYIQDVYEGRPDKVAYYSHNGYLEVLFAYGIPGALMLLIILIEWLVAGVRTTFGNSLMGEKLAMAFAVSALAHGMVECTPFPRVSLFMVSFFFFVAAGTAMGYVKRVYDGREEA